MWRWRLLVEKFVLQWHLSENCNLKCLHCYQENHKPVQLKIDELVDIYEQFKELLSKIQMKGHINITGGEPFCNPYLFKVLDLIKNDSDNISFSILTNGTLITEELAKKIKSYNPYYVQVSLDGGKKINDYIRGQGVYKKIGNAIKILRNENIFTSVSFTANNLNYKEFPKVIKYATKCGANNVWSDRYIPLGDLEEKDLTLNYKQTQEYFKIMKKQRDIAWNKKSETSISMNRALQFQLNNDFAYGCTAGKSLLTVMENGDLVPCRRMPIVVGNLLREKMINIYENSDILKRLRNEDIPEDCKECDNSETCRGGLKCLSYAVYGDWNVKDDGCSYI